MSLASRINARRKSLGIATNAELARTIGVSLPTLYGVLSGRRTPNARTIDAYARFLSVSPDAVMGLGRSGRGAGRPRSASAPMPDRRRTRRSAAERR